MFGPTTSVRIMQNIVVIKYPWRCYQCAKLLSSQAHEKVHDVGPMDLYTRKVSGGLLNRDAHQESVVKQLQHVYQEVVKFKRPAIASKPNPIFSFFKKSEPQKIIAPQGLYIYGSVGGGKTMLMDLFYETVPVRVTVFKINIECKS